MPPILRALLYLRWHSLRNAMMGRLKRLRQPKYLLGAIVGIAYFYLVFFRRTRTHPGSASSAAVLTDSASADVLAIALALGAVALSVFALLCWIWPRERASLNFSEAEIALLFPAPISRSALIHYRLVNTLVALVFTALVLALVSGNWGFVAGNAGMRLVGWWIIFTAVSLHVIGSGFVITRMLDAGIAPMRRQIAVAGTIVLTAATMYLSVRGKVQAPTADDLTDFHSAVSYLTTLLEMQPLAWLLLPARAVIGPLLSTDLRSFLIALGPALLVVAAHYMWVLRVQVAFEEASVASAQKRAARVAAIREGRWRFGSSAPKVKQPAFDISQVRRPELAFLWKNLLSTADYMRPRTAAIAAAVIVIGCTWLNRHPAYQPLRYTIGIFAMISLVYLAVLGPQFARQDLRSDLLNADILKTYPLRGWQIVLGEILTPAAIVTTLLWLALLIAALAFRPQQLIWLTPQLKATVAIAVALIMPLFCMLQLIVVNSAAVLFPAWVQIGRSRGPSGVEAIGQRILFLAGQLLILMVALVPAAMAFGIFLFVLQWVLGVTIALIVATVMAVLVLGTEVSLGVWWLGERFERFDLSAELRP